MSLSEIITPLFFCFEFFKKKGCTPTRVLFIFLPARAYMLHHAKFYKMRPPRWSVKTSERESGASIINYIHKEEMIDRQRKKVKVD